MKKYLLFLIILLIVFSYFWIKETKAAATDNVWGWAWSENIGWISFNCYNDYDDNGTLESHCTDMGYSSDYGVNIDGVTGDFSGYAWSENIGWISFETAALINCPAVPCQARLDTVTGEVTGWARACSVFQSGCSGSLKPDTERGGWEGWIHLRNDTVPYGVRIQSVSGYSEFYGWAWGGDDMSETAVIGWINFNCNNPESGNCLTSDYKVETSLVITPLNNPPTAAFSCTDLSNCGSAPSPCIGYNDCPIFLENVSTDLDGDPLTSTWYVNGAEAYSCGPPVGSCGFTPQAPDVPVPPYESNQMYTITLAVTDGEATTTFPSPPVQNYEHRRGAYAGFRCSLDNLNWASSCEDFAVEPGTVMYFKDNLLGSYPDDSSHRSYGATLIDSRTWKRDGVQFGGLNNPEVSIALSSLPSTIELTIKDDNPHGGGKAAPPVSHTIGGKSSIPIWREVSP